MKTIGSGEQFDELAIWSGSRQRNWLFVGLLVSLLLHALMCFYFYRTQFQPVDTLFAEQQQTPTFKVKSVNLDNTLEKTSTDQMNPAAKPDPDKTDVQLPDEKKSFDALLQEVHASAAMPDDTSDVLPDQPKVEQTDVNSVLNEIERTSAQTLSKSPNASREQTLFNDASASGRPQPALTGTELGQEHNDQAAEHFHEQNSRRQRGTERATRAGVQRSRSTFVAERSARLGHEAAHAGRSAFRL